MGSCYREGPQRRKAWGQSGNVTHAIVRSESSQVVTIKRSVGAGAASAASHVRTHTCQIIVAFALTNIALGFADFVVYQYSQSKPRPRQREPKPAPPTMLQPMCPYPKPTSPKLTNPRRERYPKTSSRVRHRRASSPRRLVLGIPNLAMRFGLAADCAAAAPHPLLNVWVSHFRTRGIFLVLVRFFQWILSSFWGGRIWSKCTPYAPFRFTSS